MSSLPTSAEWMLLLKLGSPMLALLAAAIVSILASILLRDDDSQLPSIAALAGLAASFALSWRLWPEAQGAKIAMIALDRLSLAAWMIVSFSGAAAAAISIPCLADRRSRGVSGARRGEFCAALLLSCFGMQLVAAAGDLVLLIIGIETMSIAAYALAGFPRSSESLEGALKYFLMGAFATAFMAMGIAFLFGAAGTTDLSLLSERAAEVAAGDGRAFFLFGCAMAIVGFAFKIAAVPFHAWAPDAYDGAPTPVTTLMATGIKAAAFLALARFALSVAAHAGLIWQHVVWALAASSMIVGNLAAIRQDNLKRMLAYSSIAHAGYLLVAFPSILFDPAESLRAALIYLVAYVLMTAGAFAAVAAIGIDGREPVELGALSGLGRKRPWLSAAFTLFMLSLAGFPPTIGFFGNYYLFRAAVRGGDVLLVVIAVLASVVSVFYYLRPVVAMYFRDERASRAEEGAAPLAPAVVAVIAVAALAVLAFGIMPENLVRMVEGTVY